MAIFIFPFCIEITNPERARAGEELAMGVRVRASASRPAMGCSSSREAVGGVVSPGPAPAPAPAERRQSLRSRSLTALTSLGMCRGRSDDVHAYTRLPSEEAPVKVTAIVPTAAAEEDLHGKGAAVEEVEERDAPATPEVISAGAVDGAASWTAAPSPAPVHAVAPDLDAAILPGLRQIEVVGSSPSHPALLYPEHDCPVLPPRETTVVEEACDVVDMGTPAARDIPEVTGIVRARVGELHEQMEKKKRDKAADDAAVVEDDDNSVTTPKQQQPATALDVTVTVTPRSRAARSGKPAVVLYFTSLRGVRRTFEECRAVRAILRCHRVRLDERDVSMHAAFRSELRDLLGGAGSEGPALPRVFAGGVDLGGADDVRALHEAGELARALAGCDEAARLGAGACVACGDARFAPCETCHGSCKVFVDDQGCRFAGFFRRCPDCNENGLIRCPVCCY